MKFESDGSSDHPFETREGTELVKGARLYMHKAFRCITCPNGELVFLRPCDLKDAYKDLSSWALLVSKHVLNQ